MLAGTCHHSLVEIFCPSHTNTKYSCMLCCSDKFSCQSNCGRKRQLQRGENFAQYVKTLHYRIPKRFTVNLCNTSGVQLLFTDARHAEIDLNVSLKNADIDHCSCTMVNGKGAYGKKGDFSIEPGCYTGNLACTPSETLSGRYFY